MKHISTYGYWRHFLALLLLFCSYSATALDRLDQQLDRLLAAELTDQQLRQRLFDLAATHETTEPSPGLVRLYGYVALEHAYINEQQQAQYYLQKMAQLALSLNSADAIAEWKSSVLEYLLFGDEVAQAEAMLDEVLLILNDAQSPRIRYYGYVTVARLLQQLERPQQALNNLQLSLAAVLETNNARTEIRRLNLLREIAQLQFTINHFDAAEANAKELIAQLQSTKHDYLFSYQAELLLAAIESKTGRTEAAIIRLEGIQSALAEAPELRNQQIYLSALNYLLGAYLDQGNYAAAATIIESIDSQLELNTSGDNASFLDLQQAIIAAGIDPNEGHLAALRQFFAAPPLTNQEALLEALGWYGDILRDNNLVDDYVAVLEQKNSMIEQLFRQRLQANTSEIEAIYLLTDKQHQINLLRQQSALDQQLLAAQSQQQLLTQWITVIAIAVVLLLAWLLRTLHGSHRALDQLNQKLFQQSMHDPLTGLLNRRALATHLQQLPADSQQPSALIIVDIDHFKRINDSLGHHIGDQVLIEVAQRLKSTLAQSDYLVRWGGEEFLIFLPQLAERRLDKLVEQLLCSVANPVIELSETEPQVITISAGAITLPLLDSSGSILNWEECLQLADQLLYASKTHGRHQAWLLNKLNQPLQQILQAIEEGIDSAQQQQHINLKIIHGKCAELPQ